MNHVYGPVPSRRIGRSLGVDVIPYKTCSYDCIYCQLGRTTVKTVTPGLWTTPGEILEEIQTHLTSRPDYITLGGSGEPTLYEPIGELIAGIKRLSSIPVAVLTNGSLLWCAGIREKLLEADLVILSLDAGDEVLFQAVNRPHADLSLEMVHEGLVAFREDYRGQYWMEVFLLAGYTDQERDIRDIARRVNAIRPDRVQLNTVARPPAESYARPVPREDLERSFEYFDPSAEVIADRPEEMSKSGYGISEEQVLEMLRRRPCTIDDLARGLGVHRHEVAKMVGRLSSRHALTNEILAGKEYFHVTPCPASRPGKSQPVP